MEINLSAVTLEDCVEAFQYRDREAIINDGELKGFATNKEQGHTEKVHSFEKLYPFSPYVPWQLYQREYQMKRYDEEELKNYLSRNVKKEYAKAYYEAEHKKKEDVNEYIIRDSSRTQRPSNTLQ